MQLNILKSIKIPLNYNNQSPKIPYKKQLPIISHNFDTQRLQTCEEEKIEFTAKHCLFGLKFYLSPENCTQTPFVMFFDF